jgi:hypothetical protein
MLETPEELDDLSKLLDRSATGAGAHLRGIITDDRRLSAGQLTGRLPGMRLLVVATVTAGGRPLAGPADGYFLHGTFWFSSARNSVRMRHLAARPAVSRPGTSRRCAARPPAPHRPGPYRPGAGTSRSSPRGLSTATRSPGIAVAAS